MNRSIHHRWRLSFGVALAALAVAGCDFLDPTQVDNPATTIDDLKEAKEPTVSLLPGLRAQFARALNPTFPEVISDNFQIRGTGINKTFDTPRSITPNIIFGVYNLAQELRALSSFVLDSIAPNDPDATAEQIQEAEYYLGMAYLLLGERFVAAPIEREGTPVASDALIDLAVTTLEASLARASSSDFVVNIQAALARAYRRAGDAPAARTAANAALAAGADLLFLRDYDENLTNGPWNFLVSRSLQEMQPLPRLDFLDPKYTTREAPIPVSKAEEMHLILAEVAFSQDDYGTGREQIALAVERSASRPSVAFNDTDDRLSEDLSERPHTSSIEIRADPTSPFRAGLVLTRPGDIDTPTISATSLDADSIRAIATTDRVGLRHALHLARQEILFIEGQRMSDLGIRLPFTLNEIETNPNIEDDDLGTNPIVPDYIPALDEMDRFDPITPYDANGNLIVTQVTMRFDLNRILAENGVSPFGTLN